MTKLPGDLKYEPTYRYECPRSHYLEAERPVAKCPAVMKGQPCDGALKRVGTGSQGPRT